MEFGENVRPLSPTLTTWTVFPDAEVATVAAAAAIAWDWDWGRQRQREQVVAGAGAGGDIVRELVKKKKLKEKNGENSVKNVEKC